MPSHADGWDISVSYEREKILSKPLPYAPNAAKAKYQSHATAVVKYNHDVNGVGSIDLNVQSYYVTRSQQHSRINVATMALPTDEGNTWRFGRMVLSHGVSYGYEPLDIFHTGGFGRLFTPETQGVDGVSYEHYLDNGDMRLMVVQQHGVDNRILKTWSRKPYKKRTIVGVQSNHYWDDAEIMISAYQAQLPILGTTRIIGAGISQPVGDNTILYASGVRHSKIVNYIQTPSPNPFLNVQQRFQAKNVGSRGAYTVGANYTIDKLNTNIIAEYSQRPVGMSKNDGNILASLLSEPNSYGIPNASIGMIRQAMRKQSLIRLSPAKLNTDYPDLIISRWQNGGTIMQLIKTWEWNNGTEIKASTQHIKGGNKTMLGQIPPHKKTQIGVRFPF